MKILERIKPVMGTDVVDLDAGALTGRWISLAKYRRVLAMVIFGDGTAGNDVTLTLQEATSDAGAGAQNLAKLQTGNIYGCTAATFAGMGKDEATRKITQGTASQTFTEANNGGLVGWYALELDESMLSSGFTHVNVSIADPGAAKLGVLMYFAADPSYAAAPESMLAAN
jgi:hypothetical protein